MKINKTENHFSDAITNFNLCENSFISNGSKSTRESVANFLFDDQNKTNEEISLNRQSVMNREDVNSFYMEKFQKEIEDLNEVSEKKKMRIIGKHNVEENIKENSFKQYFMINKMQNTPEYQEFRERVDLMNNRFNITLGFISIYALYILNNVYESKIKVYDKFNDFILKTPRQMSKINYKLHFAIMIPCCGLLFYLRNRSLQLENEFHKVIRGKYFDENFDFSQIKISLR